jgi:hypothetical protein
MSNLTFDDLIEAFDSIGKFYVYYIPESDSILTSTSNMLLKHFDGERICEVVFLGEL